MPSLHPKEIWLKTGRDETMDSILFRTKGAGDHDFNFGPSHEEVVTPLVGKFIQSYKDLPVAVYQIQTKFRNEPRAKSGILRGREFGMKDMYSFHANYEDLDAYYERVAQAYFNVFKRCGLDVYLVEASGGAFSDKRSHEFAVKTPAGEDTMLVCESCRFAQNIEIAEAKVELKQDSGVKELPIKQVHAERGISIDENAKHYNVPDWQILKSVVYKVNNGLLGVCISGDLKVNTARLEKYLKEKVRVVTKQELEEAGLCMGFISPINSKIPFIADHSVKYVKNFVTGANKLHEDLINVNLGRDFTITEFMHLADIEIFCPKCGKELKEEKAVEAGNIFKLGTRYSKDFDLKYTDSEGKSHEVIMGCYGIGNTRLIGTVVEASHDEHGIIWPKAIAPYSVHLLYLGNDPDAIKYAEECYKKLLDKKIDVLFDDRNESAGKKLNDADLIGIPLRVVISKKTLEKKGVEIKMRNEKEARIVPFEDVLTL